MASVLKSTTPVLHDVKAVLCLVGVRRHRQEYDVYIIKNTVGVDEVGVDGLVVRFGVLTPIGGVTRREA